ncbi:hypothetical protein CKA32_002123 [Geitlerinema sp. FC II]|nr:hypothetical protein CKA32_002123 [Geitlerinema sp. FC II]
MDEAKLIRISREIRNAQTVAFAWGLSWKSFVRADLTESA